VISPLFLAFLFLRPLIEDNVDFVRFQYHNHLFAAVKHLFLQISILNSHPRTSFSRLTANPNIREAMSWLSQNEKVKLE
jgi:hypothetical protein